MHNGQKPAYTYQDPDIRTNNPCCSVLLFLQVNQQKCVTMVSTLTRSTNPFSRNHPTLFF